MNNKTYNFVKYGISHDLATELISKDLNITTLKSTSIKNLINRYNLDKIIATEIKKLVTRYPIDKTVLNELLINNNFTCCCCLGDKGLTFIVHHIEEYETSQDNSYKNLAVLCPTCHDLAHSPRHLTLSISKDQLIKAKKTWEENCKNKRYSTTVKSIKPIIESWIGKFQNNLDDTCLEYLFDLGLWISKDEIYGHFTITYLNRGNMFMAGEFRHQANVIDADIEITYWGMQWGMRITEKQTSKAIINYGLDDAIHIIDFNSGDEILPYVLRLKKQPLEN
jgi:hypothetical protein